MKRDDDTTWYMVTRQETIQLYCRFVLKFILLPRAAPLRKPHTQIKRTANTQPPPKTSNRKKNKKTNKQTTFRIQSESHRIRDIQILLTDSGWAARDWWIKEFLGPLRSKRSDYKWPITGEKFAVCHSKRETSRRARRSRGPSAARFSPSLHPTR